MQKISIILYSLVILCLVRRTFAEGTNHTLSSVAATNDVKLPLDAEFAAWKRYSVSQYSAYGEKSKTLSVTTNDVVLIKRPSGAVAVVQFTSFNPFASNSTPLSASYRWRFRSAPSQAVQSGTGRVYESYDRKPSADGKGSDVTPRADHDVTVKAGGIWIDWSYGTESSGYLYYYESRAKIQILSSSAFDRDL
jgi:hypothetical protein